MCGLPVSDGLFDIVARSEGKRKHASLTLAAFLTPRLPSDEAMSLFVSHE